MIADLDEKGCLDWLDDLRRAASTRSRYPHKHPFKKVAAPGCCRITNHVDPVARVSRMVLLPHGGRVIKSHSPDVPLRRLAEQTGVLTAELRGALVPHTPPGVSGVKVLIEH